MDTLFDRHGKGNCKVLEFLDTLSPEEQAQFFNSLCVIKEFGVDTPHKFLEHLGAGIFSIRAREDRVRIRVLGFLFEGYLIATEGFKKKEDAIPVSFIKRTQKRKQDWDKNGKQYLMNILGDDDESKNSN